MPALKDPLIFTFFNEIGIIEQLSRNRAEKRFPGELKISQFSVLNHLTRVTPRSSPARMAAAFQVTRAAMTNTVQRLNELGYVKVTPDPEDGRGKIVELTAAGRKAHRSAIATLESDFQDVIAALGEDGFSDALPFLRKVRAYLDDHR